MGDEVDFLPTDKQKRFLQDDSISLDVGSSQSIQSNKFSISC